MINNRAGYQPDDTVLELPVFDSHNGTCSMAECAMEQAPPHIRNGESVSRRNLKTHREKRIYLPTIGLSYPFYQK